MRIQIEPDMDALSLLRHHFLSSSFAVVDDVEPPRYRIPRITEVELDAEDCNRLSPLIGRVLPFGDVDELPTVLFGIPVKWVSEVSR